MMVRAPRAAHLLANSPDWLKAAPMRENLLASWRQFGHKQDHCPSLPNIMRSASGFCRLIVISPTVSDWFWTQCQPDGHQISDRVVDEGPAQAVALVKQHAGGQHDSLMQGIARGPSALGAGIDWGNAQANAIRLGLAARLPRRRRRVF